MFACELMTSRCMQWTQMTPMTTRPKFPTTMPLFLIASGMARMPVPMFPFSMWMITSVLEILGRPSSAFLIGVTSLESLQQISIHRFAYKFIYNLHSPIPSIKDSVNKGSNTSFFDVSTKLCFWINDAFYLLAKRLNTLNFSHPHLTQMTFFKYWIKWNDTNESRPTSNIFYLCMHGNNIYTFF